LGSSSHRFKDLYLSGGVYLGGTGSANKLDDYETGSFSPDLKDNDGTFLSAGAQGRYTKVGDLVYITVEIYANGVSNHTSNGSPYFLLPFSADSKTNGTFLPNYYNGTGTANSGYINAGAADRLVLATNRDEPFGNSANGAVFGGSVRLYGSIVYRV